MTNFEYLKSLSIDDFAYFICIDNVGECHSACPICKRYYEDNCDDRCITGVCDFLKSEVENG